MLTDKNNLQRDTLLKLQAKNKNPLIPLKIEYSEKSKLLTSYINKLVHVNRVYPTHLPTQANFRWSTINPPLTNWPRECINQLCSQEEHEWTEQCWSLRDIITADEHEVMISWDHDNIEGRIGALLLNDLDDLKAFTEGYDLHTITCCKMFSIEMPSNLRDPHNSAEDASWRAQYNWQGKDTRQRVLAKNFNHGARYATSERFVYTIPSIERYGIDRAGLLKLAKIYIKEKKEVFDRKKAIMSHIKKTKIARNLYGARRVFFDSSEHTAKEGFNHIISSTVSHYMNETLITLSKTYPQMRFLHNAHDGAKVAFYFDNCPSVPELRSIIERDLHYQGRSVKLTASIKVYDK